MTFGGYTVLPEDWLNLLVFIHVVSAVIGIGPTFFGHVLLRKGQTLDQLRNSIAMSKSLEKFPKILGSLAVLSGLLLAWLGKYGFEALWVDGSIALYVIIQIVVIGFMAPASARLAAAAERSDAAPDAPVAGDIAAAVSRLNGITYLPTALGVLLFLFMFFKPTL